MPNRVYENCFCIEKEVIKEILYFFKGDQL